MPNTPKPIALPMFTLTSEPLPMPPEMFSLLGEIIILWSRIEASVQMDTSTMMQWPVVTKLASEAPHTFKKKLQLWRRAVRTLYPKIDAYQASAEAFVVAARKIAKVRNHVMHGQWNLKPNGDGSFNVTSMRALHHIERMETIPVSVGLLQALLSDIRSLDAHITGFIVSRVWHAHKGLLAVDREPSPGRPAHQTPAKPSKRKRPTKPSRP